MARPPAFEFYERVRLLKAGNLHPALIGGLGIVLGRTETDAGSWYYSVSLEVDGLTYCFNEDELESTGEFVRAEDMFSGETIRVNVDPDGSGRLVE
jgi:hypothetical protein